ncbi:MAG: membrane metalloprotease [Bacteroidia bacterium]|nr:membrane metalloprotease [Bacteroidia bacterium]NND53249.1 membrane metalloprotease [Flavobacteriaceae bacterium]
MKRVFAILLIVALAGWSCTKDEIQNNGDTNSDTTGDTGNDDTGNSTEANQQPTGTSANDLLSADAFTKLYIELVYVEGFEPSQASIDNFVSFLEQRTFKPNGIEVETRAVSSPGTTSWSVQNLVQFEDNNRTAYNNNNEIAVWVFFANGQSSANAGNSVVLGAAYRNTSFVIFEETIHGLSDSPLEPNRTVLESTVIMHEFGHILGLTNLGSPLQSPHEDPTHPKHCDEENCLMYWAIESGSGIDNLIGVSSAPGLDEQCIADLQANGGK